MAITTYDELVTAGENWITRDDLDDRWAEFIALAEGVANRRLDCRQMYTRNAAFSVDSVTETVPTGFAGVRAFYLNTTPSEPLTFVKADDFGDSREAAVSGTGKPRNYTIIGDAFVFSPGPDATYSATLIYRTRLTALSDDNASNWLLASHPDVYLHGMLAFAYQYIEDDAMQAKFMGDFLAGIDQVNVEDARQNYGSAPSRRVRGFV